MQAVRWLLVLPGALLARFAVQMAGGAVVGTAFGWLGTGFRESPLGEWLRLLVYFAGAMAFVTAGSRIAPQRRGAVAGVLLLVGIAVSLTMHVALQHLAGNRVGPTNWLHAGLEAAGLVIGAVLIARGRQEIRRG